MHRWKENYLWPKSTFISSNSTVAFKSYSQKTARPLYDTLGTPIAADTTVIFYEFSSIDYISGTKRKSKDLFWSVGRASKTPLNTINRKF